MIQAFDFKGHARSLPYAVKKQGNVTYVSLSKSLDYSGIRSIDFEFEDHIAQAGDEGYIVLPNRPQNASMLCRFTEKADTEYTSDSYVMPIFGFKTAKKSLLAIVSGMAYAYTLVCGVKGGKYYVFPRFEINGEPPYEDICVEYHALEKNQSDYSAMAREYRNYQLKRGACIPLKEKIKTRKELAYILNAPLIRIRMGWKPVPPTVLHQTPENEPNMIVACTFETVERFVEHLHHQGIEKADITLVGWNAKGHDGRWPDPFPVAEELGGEAALKQLIQKAQSYGYQITCHTNSTDTYEISSMWNADDVIRNADGSLSSSGNWSGGKMYDLCPEKSLEQAKKILPLVRDLGFRGIHYIDVMSIIMPRKCYHPQHITTIRDTMECYHEIMRLSTELFGGFSSEGGMDYTVKYLDFCLYISFGEHQPNLCDEIIPLWQLVYHGIVLHNPSAETVNYVIKSNRQRLRFIEYGGRPSLYINSKFVEDRKGKKAWNWMGNTDLILQNEEDIDFIVSMVQQAADDSKRFSHLQTEYMENHRKINEGVYEITYSDGSIITVDYNEEKWSITPGGASVQDVIH